MDISLQHVMQRAADIQAFDKRRAREVMDTLVNVLGQMGREDVVSADNKVSSGKFTIGFQPEKNEATVTVKGLRSSNSAAPYNFRDDVPADAVARILLDMKHLDVTFARDFDARVENLPSPHLVSP